MTRPLQNCGQKRDISDVGGSGRGGQGGVSRSALKMLSIWSPPQVHGNCIKQHANFEIEKEKLKKAKIKQQLQQQQTNITNNKNTKKKRKENQKKKKKRERKSPTYTQTQKLDMKNCPRKGKHSHGFQQVYASLFVIAIKSSETILVMMTTIKKKKQKDN